MKKCLFVLLLFAYHFTSSAQETKSFFSVKGSYSIPVGDYAAYDLDKGGFTTEGISLGAEGAWYVYKNIGFGADITYSLHSVDAIGIANKKMEDAILLNQLYVRSDPYKMMTTLVGFYYSINVINRLTIEPKLLGGMMFGKSPWQLFEQELYLLGESYYKITSSKARSFAFKAGVSFKYELSSCLALSLFADYSQSDLSYGFYSSSGDLSYKDRKTAYFDFGVGLVLLF
ncbi:hypothetical protein HNS38_00090 [Lentimicrobium sp. L6]|uniref:hypothetical protein n=1 Tax=Lentimicrobium sp. L6 TaxID=2735916 RepID=UPI001551C07E|nr:hypothetical protein [Lentimicrobium sp. L6]NPD83139.1 hypothetical protein [Lentimicrobium sp. L6]